MPLQLHADIVCRVKSTAEQTIDALWPGYSCKSQQTDRATQVRSQRQLGLPGDEADSKFLQEQHLWNDGQLTIQTGDLCRQVPTTEVE